MKFAYIYIYAILVMLGVFFLKYPRNVTISLGIQIVMQNVYCCNHMHVVNDR